MFRISYMKFRIHDVYISDSKMHDIDIMNYQYRVIDICNLLCDIVNSSIDITD